MQVNIPYMDPMGRIQVIVNGFFFGWRAGDDHTLQQSSRVDDISPWFGWVLSLWSKGATSTFAPIDMAYGIHMKKCTWGSIDTNSLEQAYTSRMIYVYVGHPMLGYIGFV